MILTFLGIAGPLILAALAGLLSERSGVMNIALEGKMISSCCAVALVGMKTGNAVLALLAGVLVATLMSLLHGVLTQSYRVDHIVSGMALNALALGGTRVLYGLWADPNFSGEVPQLPMPLYLVIALAAPFALHLYVRQTRGGVHLWAVGNDPDKAREAGLNPVTVRYLSLIMTGVLCGIAGAMILTKSGRYNDGMTAGKGFIALAALIVGGWRPLPALTACLAFALAETAQIQFQGGKSFLSMIPAEYWNTLPFLLTILALAFLGGKSKAPSGLGKP